VSSSQEWCDDAGAMRRFGLALVRDDRFVCDDASAASLVDKLFRQASLTLVDDDAANLRSARVHAFAQFVRLARRHFRRLAADEADGDWIDGPGAHARGTVSVKAAVRSLPLELREALLLVVLAGFSHSEAAAALDIPLATVIDRLGRARARIRVHIDAAIEPGLSGAVWSNAAHLRIVK